MKALVTGAAGFIGFHLCRSLLKKGWTVIGLDAINDYYDPQLKYARLEQLGISASKGQQWHQMQYSDRANTPFSFIRMNLEDREALDQLFASEQFEVVCNLAAQAGVRYSLTNPQAYVNSNIVGFVNLLECCRHHQIKHLVYASSSSVYGINKKIPFATEDYVDHPISLYAASKKSNELMAHTYSHLFNLRTTGLRFFTVYGPWGRPDMALFLFTEAMLQGKPIQVFNHGNMERDFTYIDDIVEGVTRIMESKEHPSTVGEAPYQIYNIGNSNSEKLSDFIKAIESELDIEAEQELLPMQPGDVAKTWADVSNLERDYNYRPNTSIQKGIKAFIGWYKDYYKI